MISITQLIIFVLILVLLFGDIKKILAKVQEFFKQTKEKDKED